MPFLQCEFSHVPIRGQPKSQQVRRSASNRKRCFEKILAPEAPGRRGRPFRRRRRTLASGGAAHRDVQHIYFRTKTTGPETEWKRRPGASQGSETASDQLAGATRSL